MTADTAPEGQPSATHLAPNEKFFRYFQHEVTALQEQMGRIQSHGTAGGERSDAVDHCLSAIARLSTEVQDASSFIPAYDQRTYGDAIKALNAKLQEVRSSVAPKPKFSFKSNALFSATKNESAISLNDAAELASQRRHQMPVAGLSNDLSFATTPIEAITPANEHATPSSAQNGSSSNSDSGPSSAQSDSITIYNHDRDHVVLPATASHATSSGTVSNIQNSIINISAPSAQGRAFAGLTLKNISNSLVICGHVNGAVHLTNVKSSTIVVATRQFRMHDSSSCDVYLLASSRPIIEDCSGIRFAPLPEAYQLEGDEAKENLWEKVDDFKWLRNEQSPNWSLMDPGARVEETVWKRIMSAERGSAIDDSLKAVGAGRS
ncbi:unnamed protein product [Zymoseptoria tritici ST99CH_1E4]|uniref:C-CAP/cofactor C-like domain-containing protein n=1 Tax=Zymoseptoria tritici ST99CH_1E4 TaxID=1276532 RepID=A0A2H1H409_ZYMTR|nr:unnamed protein product [Zymoseptoria tritici ST99CH_1E4]